MKPRVKEVIVVEGRYDRNALLQAVDATVVETGGFSVFPVRAPSRVAPQRRRASSSTSGRMPSTPNLPSLPGWRLRRSFPAISGT